MRCVLFEARKQCAHICSRFHWQPFAVRRGRDGNGYFVLTCVSDRRWISRDGSSNRNEWFHYNTLITACWICCQRNTVEILKRIHHRGYCSVSVEDYGVPHITKQVERGLYTWCT